MAKRDKKEIIDSISESRRDFVRKAAKAGVTASAVATFTMTGLMATPAAATSNGS